MSDFHDVMQSDPRVQDAIIALGDQDEEIHWASAAKQLGADGKKHKVYIALSHLALYIFDRDETWGYVTGKWGGRLHCRRRLPTSKLTHISQACQGMLVILQFTDSRDNTILTFSKKDASALEKSSVLVDELSRMHEDEAGEEIQLDQVDESDAKGFITVGWKEEYERMADVAKRVKVQKRKRVSGIEQHSESGRQNGDDSTISTALPNASFTDVDTSINKNPVKVKGTLKFLDKLKGSTKGSTRDKESEESTRNEGFNVTSPAEPASNAKAEADLGKLLRCLKTLDGKPTHKKEKEEVLEGESKVARRAATLHELSKVGSLNLEDMTRDYMRLGFDPDKRAAQWIKMGMKGALTSATSVSELERQRELLEKSLRKTVYDSYGQFILASREIADVQEEIGAVRSLFAETVETITQLQELPDGFEDALLSERADEGSRKSVPWQMKHESYFDLDEINDAVAELLDDLDGRIVEHRYDMAIECLEDGWKMCERSKNKNNEDDEEEDEDEEEDPDEEDHEEDQEEDEDEEDYYGGKKKKTKELSQSEARRLEAELEQRVATIVEGIWEQVKSPSLNTVRVRDAVVLLTRLRQKENAMELFLSIRTQYLDREIAKLEESFKEKKDILLYLGELCDLLFSCIIQTSEEFRSLFTDKALLSSLISWCSQRMSIFDQVFRQQVFPCRDYLLIGECVHLTRQYCSILHKSGLSLDFQLVGALLGPVSEDVVATFQRIKDTLEDQIRAEKWVTRHVSLSELQRRHTSKGKNDSDHAKGANTRSSTAAAHDMREREMETRMLLTDSAVSFFTQTQGLLSMITTSLGEAVAGELADLFESQLWTLSNWYCEMLKQALTTEPLSDIQGLSVLANAHHMACSMLAMMGSVLPQGASSFSTASVSGSTLVRGTGKDEEVIMALQGYGGTAEAMLRMYKDMWAAYCKMQLKSLKAVLGWSSIDYSVRTLDIDQAKPSEKLQKLFAQAGAVGDAAAEHLGDAAAREMLYQILQGLVQVEMCSSAFWDRYTPEGMPCQFGHGGVQQFVLDMRYCMAVVVGVCPDDSAPLRTTLSEAVERAVIAYCVALDEDLDSLLQSDEWHDQVIRKTMLAMVSMLHGLFIDRADLGDH